MARIKKFAGDIPQGLSTIQTFIVDENPNSDYFRISEFKDTFTGGKNGFLIEGSPYLRETTEVKIEVLDVEGNTVYYEPGEGIPEYYEGLSKVVSVHIYEDTPIGIAKITILGELKQYLDTGGVVRDIPEEWKGLYNVKWEREFKVNKNLNNEDKVRFYRRPDVAITEIARPIYSWSPVTVTQTGNVLGTPIIPGPGTNLNTFPRPSQYLLTTLDDTRWTGSVVNSTITLTDTGEVLNPLEVVSDTELIVSTPYTENSIVRSFSNKPYSTTFSYLENNSGLGTALSGSFGKFIITNLETFVGDVARVKVFRKSQAELADFQFVQEYVLESSELLLDYESSEREQENFGLFTPFIIDNYWVTSSLGLTKEFNQTFLYNSVKLESSGEETFSTSASLSISDGVEYTITFNTKIEEVTSGDFLEVYIQGTKNDVTRTQIISRVEKSNTLLQKTRLEFNFIGQDYDTDYDGSPKLYFKTKGTGWYISSVSLRASQETSFSPDEITFLQSVPRNLPEETFDFKFEFYDINNNYIPVTVTATKTFNGGNLNAINKRVEIVPSTLYFQFDSGSQQGNALPPKTIFFDVNKEFLTGSVNFTSGAYDQNNDLIPEYRYYGNDIQPSIYHEIQNNRFNVSIEYEDYSLSNRFRVLSELDTYFIDNISGSNAITSSNNHIELHITASENLDRLSEHSLYVLSQSSYITLLEASSSGFIDGIRPGSFASVDNDINYSVIFTTSSIASNLDVYLISSSNDIVDSIKLFDITDGFGGIVYESSDLRSFNLIDYGNGQLNKENFSLNYKIYSDSINYLSASIEFLTSQSLEEINYVSYSLKTESDSTIFYVDDGASVNYPGLLEPITTGSGDERYRLTVENFSGSRYETIVQYVEYTAECEGVSDSTVITRVSDGKGGVNFEIRPYRGNTIRNNNALSTLEVQAVRIDGINEVNLRAGLPLDYSVPKLYINLNTPESPVFKLMSEAVADGDIIGATAGVLGSGEINYNVILDRDAIVGQRTLYLIPSNNVTEAAVLATITLTDLLDGLDRGFMKYDVDTFTIDPYVTFQNTSFERNFVPSSSGVTGSFYRRGTTENPISGLLDIYPTMSINPDFNPQFWLYYITGAFNNDVSVSVTDENSNVILPHNPLLQFQGSSRPQHKQLNVTYTYTEPYTYETVNVDQTFQIVPEGKAGRDSIQVELDPRTVTLIADESRLVTDYSATATEIKVKQGSTDDGYLTYNETQQPGTFYINPDNVITQNIDFSGFESAENGNQSVITNVYDNFPTDLDTKSAKVTFPIEIRPYFTSSFYTAFVSQSIVRSDTPPAARGLTLVASSNTVTYNGDGNVVSPLSDIIITATALNTTSSADINFFIFRDGFSIGSINTGNNIAQFSVPSGDFPAGGNFQTYRVDLHDGNNDPNATPQAIASTTITGVQDGSANYQVSLTNQNAVALYTVNEQLDFSNTSTQIIATKGGEPLTAVTSFSTPTFDDLGNLIPNGEYKVTVSDSSSFLDIAGALAIGDPVPVVGGVAVLGQLDGWTDPINDETLEPLNAAGFIEFTIDFEDGRDTQTIRQNLSISFEGNVGPGLIMRGVYTASLQYLFDIPRKRRDAVIFPDPLGPDGNGETYYWATLTSSLGNPPPSDWFGGEPSEDPRTANDYWEYLGKQEFFVAAKMAIFEESFVKNTINVGNNPGNQFANIVLAGGRVDPYIAVAQSGTVGGSGTQGATEATGIIGYNRPGIFMGVVSSSLSPKTPKFSLRNSATAVDDVRYLRWDGENLEISGSNFRLTGDGDVFMQGSLFINSTNYWYNTGLFSVGGANGLLTFDGTNGNMNINDNFLVASDGTMTARAGIFSGSISAQSGRIGGWSIVDDSLESVNGRIELNADSEFFNIYNNVGSASVSIRTGPITDFLTSNTFDPDFGVTDFSTWNDSTSYAFNQARFPTSPANNSFSVTAPGNFTGLITTAQMTAVASTPSVFPGGFVTVRVKAQIASDSGFTNSLATTTVAQVTVGTPSTTVTIPAGSAQMQLNIPSSGTYYSRIYFERDVSSGFGGSPVNFNSVASSTTNSTFSTFIEAVELTDEGFQIVTDATYYFVIQRDGYGGVDPYVQIGGDLSTTGTVTENYSDIRLKNIIGNIETPLEKLKKLNGVYYTQNETAESLGYKKDDSRQVGLIAQEVQEVLPEIVHQAPIDIKRGGGSKTGENYLTIDYRKIVPLLVESIKELSNEVEELRKNLEN